MKLTPIVLQILESRVHHGTNLFICVDVDVSEKASERVQDNEGNVGVILQAFFNKDVSLSNCSWRCVSPLTSTR
jgi:hypothetical protein